MFGIDNATVLVGNSSCYQTINESSDSGPRNKSFANFVPSLFPLPHSGEEPGYEDGVLPYLAGVSSAGRFHGSAQTQRLHQTLPACLVWLGLLRNSDNHNDNDNLSGPNNMSQRILGPQPSWEHQQKNNSKQQIHNTSYKQQPTQPGRTANTTGRTAANTTNPEHQLKTTANTTGITTNESVEITEQLWVPSLFSSPTRLDCSPSVCLSCCLFFCRNGNRMPKLIITNRYCRSTRSNTHSQ